LSGPANEHRLFGRAELRFLVFPALQIIAAAGLIMGGVWLWIAIATTSLVFLVSDMIVIDAESIGNGIYVHWFKIVVWLIAGFAFCQLGLLLILLVRENTHAVEVFAAATLVGIQLGVATGTAGHELIHRKNRPTDLAVGRALFACAIRPDLPIEHVFGHHRNVGTPNDPATAKRGVGFWRYAPTALRRGFANAHHIERTRLAKRGSRSLTLQNKFLQGLIIFVFTATIFAWIAGAVGVMAFTAAACVGALTIELFNYIAHYGLVRIVGEPVAARHSWNSYRAVSTSAMINLPRHSSHHLIATQPYWELPRQEDGPNMPHGSAIMAFIAMFPSWYFTVTQPGLEAWDNNMASRAEREYLRGAGGACFN
jgi:hypothetical protein